MDEKQKVRPWNLSVVQPNTTDYQPQNNGLEAELVDQSDRIKISVKEGKEGSSSSSGVESYAKSHD